MNWRKNWRRPQPREASPVAWPAVAEAAGWAVHVQPWPGYDDARGCWWRVCLVGGAARYSLGFTGARFARSWELSRLRRRHPELEAPALAALHAWSRR